MPTSRLPSNWIQHRYLPLVVGACSGALAALLAWVVIDISHTKARAEIAAQAQSHLLQIRDRLDRQLQSTLSVPETVAAFIAAFVAVDARERATALRWERETGGITVGGVRVLTGIEDQNRIATALIGAALWLIHRFPARSAA